MKRFALISFLVISQALFVQAQEYRPLQGQFSIYSRDLGDRGPPTARDAKINLAITGNAARQMYQSMGASSARKLCDEPVRQVGDAICSVDKAGSYHCGIGINLKTGKSVLGMIC